MLPSINNYSPTAEANSLSFQTFKNGYDLGDEIPYAISITVRNTILEDQNSLNARNLETLTRIEGLEDNWDDDGAIAPTPNVINTVKAIIYIMDAIGQEIYNIAPGPMGEIMLLFNKGKKSFEVIIYPGKMQFVKYPESGNPIQGSFNIETLYTDLLSWLNS